MSGYRLSILRQKSLRKRFVRLEQDLERITTYLFTRNLLHATDKQLFAIAYHINKREQQRIGRSAMTRHHIPALRSQTTQLQYA